MPQDQVDSQGAPLLIENFENFTKGNFQRILWTEISLKILQIFIFFKIFNEKRRTFNL